MDNQTECYIIFTITAKNMAGDIKQFENFIVIKISDSKEYEQNSTKYINRFFNLISQRLPPSWDNLIKVEVRSISDQPPTDGKYIDINDIENQYQTDINLSPTDGKPKDTEEVKSLGTTELKNKFKCFKYKRKIRICVFISVITCGIGLPITVPLIIYYKLKFNRENKRNNLHF